MSPQLAQTFEEPLGLLGLLGLLRLWARRRGGRSFRRLGRFGAWSHGRLSGWQSAERQQRLLGAVAVSPAQAHHARVAAGRINEPRRNLRKELLDQRPILQRPICLTAGMNAAVLSERDEPVGEPST